MAIQTPKCTILIIRNRSWLSGFAPRVTEKPEEIELISVRIIEPNTQKQRRANEVKKTSEVAHRVTIGKYIVEPSGVVLSETGWSGYRIRQLAMFPDTDGYLFVRLTLEGKRKKRKVHKLIASAYLGPIPSEDCQIRHLDGNKYNNSVANLAWGTALDNAMDRERHGKTSRGEKHSLAIRNGLAKATGATATLAPLKEQL